MLTIDQTLNTTNNKANESSMTLESNSLSSFSLKDFLSMKIPEAEPILHPLIRERRHVMIYAPRGLGKTWLCLCLAWSAASGIPIIQRWPVKKTCRVLYIDGEMPADELQYRLRIISGGEVSDQASDNFRIMNPDLCAGPMPSLANIFGQDYYDPFIKDRDLIFVDNITSLCPLANENDAESWGPVKEWLFRMRKLGKTVVFVHHAGKNGQQRGTSSREDTLEITLALKQPSGYRIDQGSRFDVHFEKARGFLGEDTLPFSLDLKISEAGISWDYKLLSPKQTQKKIDPRVEKVLALSDQGKSLNAIVEETGIPRSTDN